MNILYLVNDFQAIFIFAQHFVVTLGSIVLWNYSSMITSPQCNFTCARTFLWNVSRYIRKFIVLNNTNFKRQRLQKSQRSLNCAERSEFSDHVDRTGIISCGFCLFDVSVYSLYHNFKNFRFSKHKFNSFVCISYNVALIVVVLETKYHGTAPSRRSSDAIKQHWPGPLWAWGRGCNAACWHSSYSDFHGSWVTRHSD